MADPRRPRRRTRVPPRPRHRSRPAVTGPCAARAPRPLRGDGRRRDDRARAPAAPGGNGDPRRRSLVAGRDGDADGARQSPGEPLHPGPVLRRDFRGGPLHRAGHDAPEPAAELDPAGLRVRVRVRGGPAHSGAVAATGRPRRRRSVRDRPVLLLQRAGRAPAIRRDGAGAAAARVLDHGQCRPHRLAADRGAGPRPGGNRAAVAARRPGTDRAPVRD